MTLGGQTIATTSINLPSNGFSGWRIDSVTFTYEGDGPNPNLLTFVNNGMGGCNSSFLDCAIKMIEAPAAGLRSRSSITCR